MLMSRLRRGAAWPAIAAIAGIYHGVLFPRPVRAQDDVEMVPAPSLPRSDDSGAAEGVYDQAALDQLSQDFANSAPEAAEQAAPELDDTVDRALAALPTGGGAISPQATALPSGPATALGMGESFTTQLSTGIAAFSIPLRVPAARGGVQPRLDLAYSSAGGFGLAGHGWSIGASAISRQSDRGVPRYDDRADWHPEQDRFVFGGMELVPICTVAAGGVCAGAISGEVMPAWASGWQYFRSRIEGGFLRFFWSPDHRTWRVQGKDGSNLELGVPLDGTGYEGALEHNPDEPGEIFRWHLARQYDSQGAVNGPGDPEPVNAVVYRHLHDGGSVYVSDIFSTSPRTDPTTLDLSRYAHHTHLRYEMRPDATVSYRQGWRVDYRLRLAGVDVASKPFEGSVTQPRELVRRYHLSYDEGSHTSLLTALQVEGRCESAPGVHSPVLEDADQLLAATNCPRLPPSTFEYQRVTGGAPLTDSQGFAFEPFVETVQELGDSPPHSLDEALTGMMDINADGLPDVVVTAPGLYDGRHGVFWNGLDSGNFPGFSDLSTMAVEPVAGIDAGTLRLSNGAVSTLDLDADGIINLVHMPPLADSYEVFRPEKLAGGGYRWRGRLVRTADRQDVKIDFAGRRADTSVMDVNGDGLVDVVYSSPTEIQTFFSLGRYPGGDDQFGHATWTSSTTADLSTDPVVHCAPWSARPVRFSDPDTYVAEMNGDGLPDLVRLRSGQILYWPGRGNGYFGTGPRDDCEGPGFAEDRHVFVDNAPVFGVATAGTLLLNDINADGLADLVEVRNQGVDIYLNDGGHSFTDRHVIADTPFRPSASNYVRLTDVDGSGSPDILWGRAREYRYIDLTGGVTPFILRAAHNGLGKTLELDYESTAHHMRRAAAHGEPWQSVAPTVSPLVVRSTVRDNLHLIGRPAGDYITEYRYRDPVYEGRQREFRGFREAIVTNLGDASNPTVMQRSVFQLGECAEGFEGTSADVCSPPERWQDNWREALKGLPVLTEIFDESGVYLSTEHTAYELRQLYTGRDGRRVAAPMPVQKDAWLYDTAAFDAIEGTVSVPSVDVALVGIGHIEDREVTIRASAGTAHVRSQTIYDDFGNTTDAIREGCIEGCPAAAFGITDEVVTAHSDFLLAPGDGSGWLWRESNAYVAGSVHTERRNEQSHTYNSAGNLVTSSASLSGTLPLDAAGMPATPQPPDLSGGTGESVELLLVDNTYDEFGHVVAWRGPNNRCGAGQVDDLYAELPVVAYTFAGDVGPDGCGATVLTHTVEYDRGFAAVTDSTDAVGQPARFEYDGFGRLLHTWGPNPDEPGTLAAAPSFIASYGLPADWRLTPFATVTSFTQDGDSVNTPSYREARSFLDGLGRTIMALSQKETDADGSWVASGETLYNRKGQLFMSCDPWFYDGSPGAFPGITIPATACTTAQFDAFGRLTHSYRRSGVQDTMVLHHALSTDVWDAGDFYSTPHQGTPLTSISDGHGRGVVRTERIVVDGQLQERHLLNEHLTTNEIIRVTQRTAGQPDVTRWLRYDSFGRMVLNVEPNTSPDFTADDTVDVGALRAWRYAYNDAGEMVGARDARGCGANYHYDFGGRILAEDRVPCEPHHAPYSAPDLGTGDGTEVFYRYDAPDPDTGNIADAADKSFDVDTALLLGRVVSVSSLGSKAVFRYDALGRGTGVAVRAQRPGTPAEALSDRYAPRWYVKESVFDAQSRPTRVTTGVTSPELLGAAGESALTFSYTKRGTLAQVAGSYGTLLDEVRHDENGMVEHVTLGDAASTRRDFVYDVDLRTSDALTYRSNIPLWSDPPPGSDYTPPGPGDDPTVQLLLEDIEYEYDHGGLGPGLITAIRDHRIAENWPDGAKPVHRELAYDDLYRLTRATYAMPEGGSDPWTSPFAAELGDAGRPQPSPHVGFPARVQQQSYAYDWLGNISQSTDDQQGFYDRSTGDRTHGTPSAGPTQLRSASNRGLAPGSAAPGDLDLGYDGAGNVTDLIVRRDGACLPVATSCWQRFHYEWDELGQITRARRWDLVDATGERASHGMLGDPLPVRTPDAELRYGYDGGGGRVLKTALDGAGMEKHTVYVFVSLELRGAAWDGTDYALAPENVSLRLMAGPAVARVVYAEEDLPSLTSGRQHLFLQFADHLGSTSFVLDHATGELVEYVSYQAYGGVDSDYRPGRWAEFREPYQFSGKESDIEVGLSYFGARYYSPYLAAWMSPDPVTIHDLGSDVNPYAYVRGTPLMGVDPDGRVVSLLIGAAIGLAIGFTSSVAVQAATVGWSNINWGIKGVLGATLMGAVSGAISGGLGSVVGQGIGQLSNAGLKIVAGAVFGAHMAMINYSIGAAIGVNDPNNKAGFVSAIAGGAAGGGFGAMDSSVLHGLASSGVGAAGSYATAAAYTGDWSFDSFALSVGSSIASAVAAYGLGQVCFVNGTKVTMADGSQKPIEAVELGDRVLPFDEACRELDVSQWLRHDFVVDEVEEGRSGALAVSLLRPEGWMTGLKVGDQVWLELEELGVQGWGRLQAVAQAQADADGAGCPVTGTFTGLNESVMSLYLEGLEEPLELTKRHRLHSATRGDWVAAVELEVGEELHTVDDVAVVSRKVVAPRGVERVYNLEVAEVHAYHVGALGVLAHNQEAGMCSPDAPASEVAPQGPNSSEYPEGITPEQYDAQAALLEGGSQLGREEQFSQLPEIVAKELICDGGIDCVSQAIMTRFRGWRRAAEMGNDARAAARAEGQAARACFVAGTLVLTREGYVAIENVEVGDEVWSFDESLDEWRWMPVDELFVHEFEGVLISVKAGADAFDATSNHPVCVLDGRAVDQRPLVSEMSANRHGCGAGGRWVEAGDLLPGDVLRSGSLNTVLVDGVEQRSEGVYVYNFEVSDTHTYTVSPLQVLVHNKPTARMLGANGTQVTSKTVWKGQGRRAPRIDVENPNPGVRAGQIHYQHGTNKYLYDVDTGRFVGAPKAVNEFLGTDAGRTAIQRALQILGE